MPTQVSNQPQTSPDTGPQKRKVAVFTFFRGKNFLMLQNFQMHFFSRYTPKQICVEWAWKPSTIYTLWLTPEAYATRPLDQAQTVSYLPQGGRGAGMQLALNCETF